MSGFGPKDIVVVPPCKFWLWLFLLLLPISCFVKCRFIHINVTSIFVFKNNILHSVSV